MLFKKVTLKQIKDDQEVLLYDIILYTVKSFGGFSNVRPYIYSTINYFISEVHLYIALPFVLM